MSADGPNHERPVASPVAAWRAASGRMGSREWVDVAILALLTLIGIAGLAPAFGFGSFVSSMIGGVVIGTAVASAGTLARLSVVTTVAIAIVAYFLLGSALAVPRLALGGVVPSLDSLTALTSGAVFGWADLITLRAPVEAPDSVAAVPLVAGLVISFVTTFLIGRWSPRGDRGSLRSALLLVGPIVAFTGGVLLGTGTPFFATVRGVLFAGVALFWLGWRRRSGATLPLVATRGVVRHRIFGTATILVGAVLVGTLAGGALAPGAPSRFVLRDTITPPFDPLTYPSPLAGFRHYTKDLEKTRLFTVRGLQTGQTIRLATMDSYDGVVWSVAPAPGGTGGSGSFELLGRTIPTPPLFSSGSRDALTIRIDGYDDIWLPNAGYATALDFDRYRGEDPRDTVRVNATTGTIAVTSGVSRGLDYTLHVDRQRIPNDRRLRTVPPARVDLPRVGNVPDIVAVKADEYAGRATSALQKLRNIERSLKTLGFLSHGRASDPVPSRAGEGADRMSDLFTSSPMVGDQEQYASAFALMARHLGYPSRVVLGFAPKVRSGSAVTAVTGDDITAWSEVAFQGVGWVPFYPTPTKTDAPKAQTVKPKLEPQPQVRQPPRTNPKPDELLTPVKTKDRQERKRAQPFVVPVWVWVAGGILAGLALLYLIPLVVIALLKYRRRRRRRSAADSDVRGAGPWEELTDRYVELGFVVPERLTRILTAAELDRQTIDQHLEGPEGGLDRLARIADEAVFADDEFPSARIESSWAAVDAAVARISSGAGRLRRRLASFRYRRRPRPPRRWRRRGAGARR